MPAGFLKNEFLLAVIIGMLVLAFVHINRKDSASDDEEDRDSSPARYMKIFMASVLAVYALLYLLSSVSLPVTSSGTVPVAPVQQALGSKATDVVNAMLEHIDLNDPSF